MGLPVGADGSPSEGAAERRRGCRGVVRSTASLEVAGALGVEGAWWPSAAISMASSPWRGLEGLGEESGEASGRGGRTGRARHSREKASWSQPQLGQWGGEVGQHPETGFSCPPLGQVGFWHRWAERV